MAKKDDKAKKSGKKSGDKDWKAIAKDLRKKLDRLKEAQASDGVEAAPAKKKAIAISPLAPAAFPEMPQIEGVEFAAAAAGVRYKGRTDVMLARLAPGTAIAGAFTRSSTRAACVLDCQAKLSDKVSKDGAAILVNSGNANAFTGSAGLESVARITEAVGRRLGVPASRVFTSSTGVIGEPLPHDRIIEALDALEDGLDPGGIVDAARAIMTTDTFPKGASAEIETPTGTIRIAGIAKGSGMIAPDMATMLVYIFTDAKISPALLQKIVSRQVDDSFNCITVDSDTSTSDALIMAATGTSRADELKGLRSLEVQAFEAALRGVMMDLAHQVVKDGEGATKFVEVRVSGARTPEDAHRVAMAIANSPLVKTAVAGEDANWGRVVMAVGKSGAHAERDLLSIRFGDILVAEKGWRSPDYSEEQTSAYMKNDELVIAVDLGLGSCERTVWTCDLTHAYIDINADYRS